MNAEKALRRCQPYLVGKAGEAELALEYRRTALGRGKRAEQEDFYRRLQATKNYTRRSDDDDDDEADL